MSNDGWIKAALNDSSLVAELLLTMKHSQHSSFKPVLRISPRPPISVPSGWGCKRLRSASVFRCDAAMATKIGERIRISPSTPLSWSGGSGSPSSVVRGADGCEASSIRFNSSFADSRSKGALSITNESASNLNRKPRKKMSFAKLKEEENKLLNERICLTKNIEALRATLEEQTARNLRLKRLKVEHNQQQHKMKTFPASDEQKQALLCPVEKSEAAQQRHLFDLNATPSDGEFDSCT